jgi:hypothetical protein
MSTVRRCLSHNLRSQPYGSKSLVRSTGSAVSMFYNFIPTLTEHERHLHLIKYSYKPPFNKYYHTRESVVSRID